MNHFIRTGLVACAVAAFGLAATAARAGSVTFSTDPTKQKVIENGVGFGTVLSVLSVQNNGTEWGAVGVQNGTIDSITLDNKGLAGNASNSNGTNLQPVSALFALDPNFIAHGDTLGLVFNVNQEGSDLHLELHDFYVDFYKSDNTLLYSLRFNDSDPSNGDTSALIPVDNNGTGTAGWLFQINMTATEYFAFFGTVANPSLNNFLGMHIRSADAIGNSNDGQDNFYLIAEDGPGHPPIIGATPGTPLPPSMWAGLAMLGGLGGMAMWRKRRLAVG